MPENPTIHVPTDWYRNEDFWIESYRFMFPEKSFREAESEIARILERAGCAEGRVLDLGCGPGRYAVPLARRGFDVTGVDASGFLLGKASEYAEREDVEVEWVREDMHDFRRPGTYRLALSLTTSFGFFDQPDQNLNVARNLCESLEPGGVLLIDLMGKEILARDFEATWSGELDDGTIVVQRRRMIDDWSRMDAEWIYIHEDRIRSSFRLRLWIYSARELRELLAAAGFPEIELYGDLEGSPYGPEARRLIAAARKS